MPSPSPSESPPAVRDALSALRISRETEPRRSSVGGWLLKLGLGLFLIAACVVGGFLVYQQSGLADGKDWIPDAIRSRPEVRVARVTVETGRAADAVVVATGYIKSYRQARIGARAAGRIQLLHVEEGSRVTNGEVIAVLDHKDIDAALAGAKAAVLRARAELGEQEVAVARSQKELTRNTRLRQTNILSESDFDKIDFEHRAAVAKRETLAAAVVQAEAREQEAEQLKENMIVRAPFSGTVISKDAEVGESILPGGMGEASGRGSVVTIADLERLEVDCDVKEDFISRVTQGSPAEVGVDAVPGRRYAGRVRKVIPMGDRARATVKVRVEILDADERLFPDMGAKVFFLPQPGEKEEKIKERRVFCDSAAIVSEAEKRFVWQVADDLRVRRTEVTTGNERDGRTEILEGLSGGEQVIVGPSENLQPGQAVKLRE